MFWNLHHQKVLPVKFLHQRSRVELSDIYEIVFLGELSFLDVKEIDSALIEAAENGALIQGGEGNTFFNLQARC